MQDSTHRIRKCDCTLLPLGKLRLLQLRSIILQVPPTGMLIQLQDSANRESSESLDACKFNRGIGEPHLVRSSS